MKGQRHSLVGDWGRNSHTSHTRTNSETNQRTTQEQRALIKHLREEYISFIRSHSGTVALKIDRRPRAFQLNPSAEQKSLERKGKRVSAILFTTIGGKIITCPSMIVGTYILVMGVASLQLVSLAELTIAVIASPFAIMSPF